MTFILLAIRHDEGELGPSGSGLVFEYGDYGIIALRRMLHFIYIMLDLFARLDMGGVSTEELEGTLPRPVLPVGQKANYWDIQKDLAMP